MFKEANRKIIEAEVPQIASKISTTHNNQNTNNLNKNKEETTILNKDLRLVLNRNFIKNPDVANRNRTPGYYLTNNNTKLADMNHHLNHELMQYPLHTKSRIKLYNILYNAGGVLTLGLLPYILGMRILKEK